ncbi:MAG: protein-L-isoaspartate(D-aspartate) O-methyltransferase [Deferrisomatales bacterium]|nr:protein-L-isoaspartate(D-aspartate) O-methyltransferase [Deferrisomatales bacterium]
MRFDGALRRLLREVAETSGASRSDRVLGALARVPRHLFVEEALWARAYTDDALPIGYGQTISKPSTVARMTEALDPAPGDRVLEVGTGSGYQAAVLAFLGVRLYTVERIPALALRARRVLVQVGAFGVSVRPGDGAQGWPEAAPFRGILVTAAAPGTPRALLEQLEVGGRLVLPVAEEDGQSLRRLVRTGPASWAEETLEPCRFVPLVGRGGMG